VGGDDIGAPKNLGEEYRWNTPVITYGFDSSFLNYFGSNGVAAIDAAFEILNSLPPFSTMDQELSEFPIIDPLTGTPTTKTVRGENARAAANSIIDLKSEALVYIIEELGLASPERWVWALRDRRVVNNNTATNYLVIQRNFDPVDFSPSRYVNGERYTYQIAEFDNPAWTDALEQTVDPEAPFSSVAGQTGFIALDGALATGTGLSPGVYYNYLTRDDIGGLRYLYQTNNLNIEPFAAGTQIFAPDTNLITITNLDLTAFSIASTNNSPSQLVSLYPGLIITQATPIASIVISNAPTLVTNLVPLLFRTNTADLQVISNIDLTAFTSATLTNDPNALRTLFPNLVIASTNQSITARVDIASITLTNGPRYPWGDPFATNFILVTNYVTNLAVLYHYTFRNVITNDFSPVTLVTRVTSGLQKEPWSDPLNPVFKTNTSTFLAPVPSGGVIIIPTNLFGYDFNTGYQPISTLIPTTNILVQTNFIIDNVFRSVSDVAVSYFTNKQFAVYPIEFLPPGTFTNIVTTNFNSTNIVISYAFKYANVITNYSSPTTPVTQYSFSITQDPRFPGLFVTNITRIENLNIAVPSGGFLIDTNQTGFLFTGINITNIIPVTNTVVDITNPVTGERIVRQIVYNFTNVIYTVAPFILQPAPAAVLRGGVDKINFVKVGNGTIQGNFNSVTNTYRATYFTNGMWLTASFQRVSTLPDILFAAADLDTDPDDGIPFAITRTASFQNNAALNSQDATQGGPGNIVPPITITFSKLGPHILNQFPGFITEESALTTRSGLFVWGSFDGTPTPPIVFPKDISLEQIEHLVVGTNP
jgi:hypothetical protein